MSALRTLDVVGALAALLLAGSLALRLHDMNVTARAIAAHCDSLDAIAVRTPDGWECVSRAIIPADTAR